jgi:tRNA threonylcarbamoyl adenosine modification protein (Sua5/YciO/YrdC/YwlC family)
MANPQLSATSLAQADRETGAKPREMRGQEIHFWSGERAGRFCLLACGSDRGGLSHGPVNRSLIVPLPAADRPAVDILKAGGVIALPTDTLYGIGCAFDRSRAIERIVAMRGIDRARRPLTLMIPDLGELARYTQVTEAAHGILSRIFPGPYCVELVAGPAVPDPYVVGRRRTIGVRIPDYPFCERLLWALGTPILTATAKSRAGKPLTSAAEIAAEFGADLDLIVDAGVQDGPPSTVVSLVDDWVTVLRRGRGDPDRLL